MFAPELGLFVHILHVQYCSRRDVVCLCITGLYSKTQISNEQKITSHYYVEPGFIYTFMIHLECIDMEYKSNETATHSVLYTKSPIQASIAGNDIYIAGMTPEEFRSFDLVLNGELFTYDRTIYHQIIHSINENVLISTKMT